MSVVAATAWHGGRIGGVRDWWCWLFCAMALWVAPAQAQVQRLDSGQAVFHIAGQPDREQAVTLPLHWDIQMPGQRGRVDVELAFSHPADRAAQPWSVLIPRLGNAWRIAVNGALLQEAGALDQPDDGWAAKRPVRIQIPAMMLREHNVLTISLRADIGRRAGLARVTVGPTAELHQPWLWQEWTRIALPQAASVLSMLVAGFCLLLWWQQREQLYAAAAVGEAAWALRLADTWWEASPLDWPWWGLAMLGLFWIWGGAIYLLARAVWDGRRPALEQRVIAGLILAGPVCFALAWWLQSPTPSVAWMLLSMATWWWLVLRLGVDARREPSWPRWMMVVALAGCLAALTRDIYAGRASALLFEEAAWSKYAAVSMALFVLLIVGTRFHRAREALVELNRSISARIAQRERELQEEHAKVTRLERDKAAADERGRILRDMHDGAGAHLIAAIRLVEDGQAGKAELLHTLGESLDQLRLSVDALNLPAGDINGLLANLRFRLDRRIQAAGLKLVWHAHELPVLGWCTGICMRHIQFIVLEAISNVLQHAGARQLVMTARTKGQSVEIELRDDGVGLQGPSGNGLRTMQERATMIGAVLELLPARPGLALRLTLPVGAASGAREESPTVDG